MPPRTQVGGVALGRKLDEKEIDLIRRTQMPPNCPAEVIEDVVKSLVHFAENTGLDPLLRQCWATVRQGKISVQATIDGFRIVAGRSGEYEGQTEPQWCGSDGAWHNVWTDEKAPMGARVGIYRKGFREPIYAPALHREYVQLKDGHPNSMWRKMPSNQLLKCSEALALRKAFPEYLSGIYTDAEMGQAENDDTPEAPHEEPQAAPAAARAEAPTSTARGSGARRGTAGRPAAGAQAPAGEGVQRPASEAGAKAPEQPPQAPSAEAAPAEGKGDAAPARAQAASSDSEKDEPQDAPAPRPHATANSQVSAVLGPVREAASKLGIAPTRLQHVFRDRYGHTTRDATATEALEFAGLALRAPTDSADRFVEFLKTAKADTGDQAA